MFKLGRYLGHSVNENKNLFINFLPFGAGSLSHSVPPWVSAGPWQEKTCSCILGPRGRHL